MLPYVKYVGGEEGVEGDAIGIAGGILGEKMRVVEPLGVLSVGRDKLEEKGGK